jgi:hypothetical protein
MIAIQERSRKAIPGPHQFLGPLRAAISFFKDPIGYLDTLFDQYGKLVWVKTLAMATPPNRNYPGTVFLYGPELIRQVVTEHDAYYRVRCLSDYILLKTFLLIKNRSPGL